MSGPSRGRPAGKRGLPLAAPRRAGRRHPRRGPGRGPGAVRRQRLHRDDDRADRRAGARRAGHDLHHGRAQAGPAARTRRDRDLRHDQAVPAQQRDYVMQISAADTALAKIPIYAQASPPSSSAWRRCSSRCATRRPRRPRPRRSVVARRRLDIDAAARAAPTPEPPRQAACARKQYLAILALASFPPNSKEPSMSTQPRPYPHRHLVTDPAHTTLRLLRQAPRHRHRPRQVRRLRGSLVVGDDLVRRDRHRHRRGRLGQHRRGAARRAPALRRLLRRRDLPASSLQSDARHARRRRDVHDRRPADACTASPTRSRSTPSSGPETDP